MTRSHSIARTTAAALLVALAATLIVISPGRADATIALRQRFFGHQNVDPVTGDIDADDVILSWFGVTNFAAAINGHVVLLDAWVPRGEYSGYVPTSPAELAMLDPEFIFVGHGHFDHAADAAEIAALSDATLVGTPEHCDQAREQAAPDVVECVGAVPRGSAFGATAEHTGLLGPEVGITVLKHVHSAAEQPDPSDTGGAHTPVGTVTDPRIFAEHLPAPQDTVHLASHLGDAEGDSLLWQFRIGDFALTWHDSSGPLKERAPHVLDQLAALPAPTDVEVGAVMGFNQITNGLRDPRMYIERIAPKIWIPSHHDNWAPGLTSRGEDYEQPMMDEIARIPEAQRPIVRWISDPQDYVRPEVLTFDVNAAFWD